MAADNNNQNLEFNHYPTFTQYPEGLTPTEALAHYAVSDRSQPWVRAMMISSLDGAASVAERSGGLGDQDDQLVFTTTRAVADAVVVGAGTVRVEGYDGIPLPQWALDWRKAQGLSPQPRLVILSRSGVLPWQQLDRAQQPPLVVVQRGGDQGLGEGQEGASGAVEKLEVPDITDLASIMAELRARGYAQIVLEGGPTVLASAHRSGVIDELCLSLSPLMVGGPGPRIVNERVVDGDMVRKFESREIIAGTSILFLRYWAIRDTIDQ